MKTIDCTSCRVNTTQNSIDRSTINIHNRLVGTNKQAMDNTRGMNRINTKEIN